MGKLIASLALLVSPLLFLSGPTCTSAGEAKVIIGSNKATVDALLAGWELHRSSMTSGDQLAYDYQKDVNLTVWFKAGKASGVAVTDRGSAIPEARYQQLVTLTGGGEPKAQDVLRAPDGIHSFSVGETL